MATKHRLHESVFPSASKEELAKLFFSFTDVVKYIMGVKKITRKQFIEESKLKKGIISRILSNRNGRNSSYCPSCSTICSVCVGLKITFEDYEIVKYIAELVCQKMNSILDRGLSIDEANDELYDEGLPLLGSQDE